MAYPVKKEKQNGKRYWHIVKSERNKNGKPRQKYLDYVGSVEKYSREEAEAIAKQYKE